MDLTVLLPTFEHLGLWGYAVVFLFALTESFVLIGSVIPGSVAVIIAGFFASQGYLHLGDLMWFAAIGAILGDGFSYYLGTKGVTFFRGEGKLLKRRHLESAKRYFAKHGGKSVLLGRFAGPLRPIVPFVAGLSAMPRATFLWWNISSAFLWAISHLLVGYFFGNAFSAVVEWSSKISVLLIAIGILWVIGYFTYQGPEAD